MRTPRGPVAGLMALMLVVGLAACGSDDDTSADATTTEAADETTTTAAGVSDEFCGAVIDFNSAVVEVELDETSTEEDIKATGAQLAPLFDTIASGAPDDLAATATELNEAVQALTEGDGEAFNADSTFETYGEFLGGAIAACEFETVAVTGIDYAFQGVPETIAAGTTAFAFTNASDGEEHEMIILTKAEGEALSFQEILALPEEEAMMKAQFVGATFAPPGGEGSTLADLEPGSYVMACFIPVGGGEDGPPHFTEGMIQEFTVE
jgi:hypothetical protein